MDLHDITEEEIRKYAGIIAPYENRLKNDDAVLVHAEVEYLTNLGWQLQKIYSVESITRCGLIEKIFRILGDSQVREMRFDSNAREAHALLLGEQLNDQLSAERRDGILKKIRHLEWDNYHH